MQPITCFKAYDVRGRVPDELNEEIVYRIGRAYAAYLEPEKVVIGKDIRTSSEAISSALARGLEDSGVHVFDIGLCGTEQVYFATFHRRMDGGIMVTASHNPPDFNGLKFVREQSRPISADSGLMEIRELAERNVFETPESRGEFRKLSIRDGYITHLLSYVKGLRPLKIVINAGNGGAGRVVDLLEPHLPFEFVKIHHEPDGNFPNGVPNPLLEENRQPTSDAIKTHGADLGIAWDGDFDRCFFFDERGAFVEGYYLVGLLASMFLAKTPGAKIVHDPRLTWNTIDLVEQAGGVPVLSKSGHAFIKETMRREDAVYGGEMSAHHYFRDFSYCDSGMIPWLLITQLMSDSRKPLSQLVGERMARFPASGEINREVPDPAGAIEAVTEHYERQAIHKDFIDGVSLEFPEWRFNLRPSNTEPLIRLNVESRADKDLMEEKTAEILAFLDGFSA